MMGHAARQSQWPGSPAVRPMPTVVSFDTRRGRTMRGKPHRKGPHARPRTVRPKTDEAQSASESAAVGASQPRRKCVLVVEDNATIGGLLVALLREEGYRALRAWDGR